MITAIKTCYNSYADFYSQQNNILHVLQFLPILHLLRAVIQTKVSKGSRHVSVSMKRFSVWQYVHSHFDEQEMNVKSQLFGQQFNSDRLLNETVQNLR